MLPNSLITTTLVGNTIGVSTRSVSLLIVIAKQGGTNGSAFDPTTGKKYNNALPHGNIFSTNSPYEWFMPTDAKGVCTGECYNRVRRKGNDKVEYRLGDWRSYNHVAKPPSITITDKEIHVTTSNSDGSGRGVVFLTLFTGDYDWRQAFKDQLNERMVYVINIYRGTKKADGSILWTNPSFGQTKYEFDAVSDTNTTLRIDTVSGGSTTVDYVFKAVVTMEYLYHPGTVNEVIKSVTFTNHTMTIESNLVPVIYTNPAPDFKVNNIDCWYTDYDTGEPDYTSAAIVSQQDASGAWKRVTAIIEQDGAEDFDWDTNPDIYMTVYAKDGTVRYDSVYCNSFGLRKVPVHSNFTFNITKPSTVTLQPYDEVYIDIRKK